MTGKFGLFHLDFHVQATQALVAGVAHLATERPWE